MMNNIGIRNKLLISYSIVFILSFSLGSAYIYYSVRQTISANIEKEMKNNAEAVLGMVKTAAAVSIKNHLRAVSEKNLEMVSHLYKQFRRGLMTEAQARQLAAGLLLDQTIGQSGYNYCIDSKGTVEVHPSKALVGANVARYEFVRKQITLKTGYLEYDWKNPEESVLRPKALYMVYFKPWDWIISTSSYRDEFRGLVNVEDFEPGLNTLHSGRAGRIVVLDCQGNTLIMPKDTPENIPDDVLRDMLRRKTGQKVYSRPRPDGRGSAETRMFFDQIPEYGWIVASFSNPDDVFRPLTTIRNLILLTVAFTLILVLPISFEIGASITRPLRELMRHLAAMKPGDFSYRMQPGNRDEIGQLAGYFNRYMQQLAANSLELSQEVAGRRRVEEALRESEARYRSVMAAAPDPIVLYDMQGRVTYLNPAFTRIFGWRPEECLGNTMDHFVPEENWSETRMMIDKALAGQPFSGIETRRYNKQGQIVWVSNSCATFPGRDGELAGCVIILRDITAAKQLEQQVMTVADRERQRIGQNLHDDLCPQLIGIQGLCAVLAQNLAESGSEQAPLAQKTVPCIDDAIRMARSLARGLCPVHLVAHGLTAALEEILRETRETSGITCRFTAEGVLDLWDNTLATQLYYIAREAVANAVKHAHAREISVCLKRRDNRIHLKITDNGRGFSPAAPTRGMGLQIMRQRAKMIGATFGLETAPDGGTTIRLTLNLPTRTGELRQP